MARLFVVTITLWCFSTQARAQVQLDTAGSAVKQANGKTTARREATGKPASAGGGSCDIGVVITAGDEFTVQTTGLTVFQNKKMVVPIPGWGLQDLIFARIRATIPAGVSVLRIPYNPAKFPPHDESKDTLKDRLFRDLNAELAEYMRQVAKGTNCRHYIQILNSISRIGSSNYTVRGSSDPALRDGVRAMLTESLDKTLPLMLGVRSAARESGAR